MKKFTILLGIAVFSSACSTGGNNTEAEDSNTSLETQDTSNQGVYFVSPANGDTLQSPVKVVFGVDGMEVEPAGAINEGKGHHHIIIDGTHIAKGQVVPADSVNIHYGKGQLEDELVLTPGKHTLTMQFADGFHQSYGEDWSNTIEIYVEDGTSAIE